MTNEEHAAQCSIEGGSMKANVFEVEVALLNLVECFYDLKEREQSLSSATSETPRLVLIQGGLSEPLNEIAGAGQSVVGELCNKVE